jgi:hypothetical protein
MKWNNYTFYILILVLLFFTCNTAHKETFSTRASDQTTADLSSNGKVRPTPQSILRTAWTNVTLKPKEKSGVEKFASIMNPKETVIFRGQPKYIMKHAIIVGRPFTMSVEARSLKEATQRIKQKAAEELEGINHVLRTTNLYAG